MGSQLLQNTEINIVLHWKFWRKYGHLFSCNNWIYNYFTECIVGDITPHDGVSEEDKHSQEMNAMTILVKNLPTGRVSLEFFNAFERYVFSILMFLLYFWFFLVNCKSIRYIFNFCLMHFEILFLDINVIILNIGRFYNIELQIEMYSGYFLWSIKRVWSSWPQLGGSWQISGFPMR